MSHGETRKDIAYVARVRCKNEYSTAYSQAVTHPSTNAAQCCLTSVIGRELVFSTWYGRIQLHIFKYVPMDILNM